MYSATTATRKILALNKRIQIVAGGTSASKTISNLLKLIQLAQTDKTPKLTSIVSETMPHIKRGAERDFKGILLAHGYWVDERWNATDHVYTFETGSKIEFFSADQPSKTRGPRRDRLFLNEGNNIGFEAADQMMVRTKELIIIDYNPTNEFWAYTEIMQNERLKGKYDFVTLTYKDNEALAPEIVESIESHRDNKAWWTVYGLGQLGEIEGKVFRGWKIIEEIPHEARLERRGMDFGYSNDPTVIVNIYYYNGGYILDEVVYRTGMLNAHIADMLMAQENQSTLVIADSAELKSIDEIASRGVPIIGVIKRPGYVRRGSENSLIDWVQTQQVSITKRSTNLIKSYRNFMWQTDKEGKILNEYDHFWSDGMMATIYGLSNYQPRAEDTSESVHSNNVSEYWTT